MTEKLWEIVVLHQRLDFLEVDSLEYEEATDELSECWDKLTEQENAYIRGFLAGCRHQRTIYRMNNTEIANDV